jgi:hypothetical protein
MDMHTRHKNIQKEDIFVSTYSFQVPTALGTYLRTKNSEREGEKKKKKKKKKENKD